MGIEAIRTPLLNDARLLTLADTLGLHIFQELPLDDVPASSLVDTLDYAQRLLSLALTQARGHSSARHFGLARRSDTSSEQACTFFNQLAEQVHRQQGGQVYYLTRFIESDRCAHTVDFVLLDALDVPSPNNLVIRWQDSHSNIPIGIGTLGTWIEAISAKGLQHPRSPESQARYLENHLTSLLAAPPALFAVFIYRWRDFESVFPSPSHNLAAPKQHGYGLFTMEDTSRLAHNVVQGFYTKTQKVFAFQAGGSPGTPVPWSLLLGWLVFTMIGACYALSSRFRNMVPRYFLAHGFYCESVREGREIFLGASVVLFAALALSVGIVGSILLEVIRTTPAFQIFLRALPIPVQSINVALLAQPWLLVLLLGSIYALATVVWTSLLSFVSRRHRLLMPGQVLMLVIWPRWPFLGILIGAMVAPSLPDSQAVPYMLILAGAWFLCTFYGLIRTLTDYRAVTRISPNVLLFLGLANPLIVFIVVCGLFALELGPTFTFLWHVATRS